MNDGILDIAIAASVESKSWKNTKISWVQFKEKLCTPSITQFTLKEYRAMSKPEQSKVKDVGGYVGAFLTKGRRAKTNVRYRQLVTLDIDYADMDFWDTFTMLTDSAAFVHSTHSHTNENPRFRLIMPLARKVTRDEYQAIARKVADSVDIELFDPTTFDVNRLMFWPAIPRGTEMYIEQQEGPWLDPDEILGSYKDWQDTSTWPRHKAFSDQIHALKSKQEDPRLKDGLVGAFCRAYDIHEAILTFLSDEYIPNDDDRYTYTKGSTSNGVLTYDNLFSYSHHGTDPTSGRLCNVYDLIRIHKFGHLDINLRHSDEQNAPSVKAMLDFIMNDSRTMGLHAKTKMLSAQADFESSLGSTKGLKELTEDNMAWVEKMETDKRGNFLTSSKNINLLLENHPHLQELFWHDEFKDQDMVSGVLPWDKKQVEASKPFDRIDLSCVRNYLDTVFNIASPTKVEDAINIQFFNNSRNPLTEYLDSLVWDQVPRIKSFGPTYYDTEDTEYVRAAFRVTFVGAVARAYKPGCQFDTMLVLVGSQGCGKSTFVRKFGLDWMSDSLRHIGDKDSLIHINQCWLVEIAELVALQKSRVNDSKGFITATVDKYRKPYDRQDKEHPRKCVFVGTTNNYDFLIDSTGNRRFLPVEVALSVTDKNIFTIPREEVDQIWAEAVALYKAGSPTYFDESLRQQAEEVQEEHLYVDPRLQQVEEYLEKPIPLTWYEMDTESKMAYLEMGQQPENSKLRDFCTPGELWTECFGFKIRDINRRSSREMLNLLEAARGWTIPEGRARKRILIQGVSKIGRVAYRRNRIIAQDTIEDDFM